MTDSKIDIVHYNRNGEEIELYSTENKKRIKEIIADVINKTLIDQTLHYLIY